MSIIDDGYIKYDRSFFTQSGPLQEKEFLGLEKWRAKLFQLHLIGEYLPEKIGYGNMSQRMNYLDYKDTNKSQFCITATQTGSQPHLNGHFYTRVLDYDLENNRVYAHGPREASSESLTHAAIYGGNSTINVIFHIHSQEIWQGMIKDQLLSTSQDIPYGTKEMAYTVQKLVENKSHGYFVMKGHQDGVVIFGRNLDETGQLTLELHELYKSLK